jgi:hypothetical protein
LIHAIWDDLDVNERVAEVGISDNEHKVVRGERGELYVEWSAHCDAKFHIFCGERRKGGVSESVEAVSRYGAYLPARNCAV